ncbi:MAG: glycoside hydrolase family 27 protein [Clostridia bacterium]|nr:glycoside hydrolase family 27 protein [Clostridia bacterium]
MIVRTPPMGFNTCNPFGDKISEGLIIEICDAMVEKGFRDAGYEYIVIDDWWSEKSRDKDGNLVPDREKFPHGLKYLSDYIHSKGMKFGIYSSCGPLTCAGYPGSLDHEFQDAKFFAENGVDYLKYDWCYHPRNLEGWTLYNRMKMALSATGRDILYSVCNWGEDGMFDWVRSVGANMYRSTGDISDRFDIIKFIAGDQCNNFNLSGPSCYNDMDMLVCGLYGKGFISRDEGGCTAAEYSTHFKLWCMLGAPLMLGCDVRNIDDESRKLLLDPELIAIDQDPDVRPPFVCCSRRDYTGPVMMKHMANGEYVFSLTNYLDEPNGDIQLWTPDIGLSVRDGYGFRLHDVETGEELGIFTDVISAGTIGAHDTKVLRGTFEKL